MSEAPERISVYPIEGAWGYGGIEFAESDEPEQIEYVRADRIEELEAKLAKAINLLHRHCDPWGMNDFDATTLAELKEESRE